MPTTPESEIRMETPSWKSALLAGLVSAAIMTGLFYLFILRVGL